MVKSISTALKRHWRYLLASLAITSALFFVLLPTLASHHPFHTHHSIRAAAAPISTFWTSLIPTLPTTAGQAPLRPQHQPQPSLSQPSRTKMTYHPPNLADYKDHPAHNYHSANDSPGPAYATIYTSTDSSTSSSDFLALKSLIYHLLWSPSSHSEHYPVIVLVAPHIPQSHRTILLGAGAIVQELPRFFFPTGDGDSKQPAPLADPVHENVLALIHAWSLTAFSRLVMLPADARPGASLDALFDQVHVQECDHSHWWKEMPEYCRYAFAGLPFGREPEDGSEEDDGQAAVQEIGPGLLVLDPDYAFAEHLQSTYRRWARNNVNESGDEGDKMKGQKQLQKFLNWQFGAGGSFPAQALNLDWDDRLRDHRDDIGSHSENEEERFWLQGLCEGEEWDEREECVKERDEVAVWYASDEFQREREKDVLADMVERF